MYQSISKTSQKNRSVTSTNRKYPADLFTKLLSKPT